MNRIVSLVSLFAVLGVMVATAAVYFFLPDPMPTHFDLFGKADGWSSRAFGAWFVPIVAAAIWIGARFTKNAMMSLSLGVTSLFMVVLHVLVLRAALDGSNTLGGGFVVLLGLLDVALGLIFPRLRRNRWVGIRLPWTLASDEAWNRAHRFGGAVFFFGGLLTLASVAILGSHAMPAAIVILLVMTLIVSVQSYRMRAA